MPPELSHASTSPHELQPWTAARCQRLLRQLQSRLAGLRKLTVEAGVPPSHHAKRPYPIDDAPQAPKRVRFTYGRRRPAPGSGGGEPSDTTMTTPPRVIRTLGAMEIGKSIPVCGLDISTPVWRKIREQPDTPLRTEPSPSRAMQRMPSETESSGLRRELRRLRQMVPEQRYRIYEAIFHWLDGLLRSTVSEAKEPHRRSLLGMCLRNIPACIKNIEAYERQVARENGRQSMWDASHVSFDLYGQLEALGSYGHGWRPLKLAVRSHGVSLLLEAVAEGLFEPEFVWLLTRLCLQLGCRTEAGILTSCVGAPLPAPRSMLGRMADNRQLLPLHEMLKSLRGPKPLAAALQSVASLVSQGSLPLSWLSTRVFSTVWETCLESMTASRMGPVVTAFISTCLPLLAPGEPSHQGYGPGDREKTFISIVAGAVVAATTATAARGAGKERRRWRCWRRVLYLLELCLAEIRHRKKRRQRHDNGHGDGQFILALARHLVVVDSPLADVAFKRQAKAELKKMAQGAEGSATMLQYYHQSATILARLTQYRSRSSLVPGREIVAELCTKLDNLELGGYFSSGLRTDVAFLLAQQTEDLRDLAFAESLPSAGTPGRVSTVFSGWRWEEGISEWVLPKQGADSAVNRANVGIPPQTAGRLTRLGRHRSRTTGPALAIAAKHETRMITGCTASFCSESGSEESDMETLSSQGQSMPSFSNTAKVRRRSLKLLWPSPDGHDWDDLI